MTTFTCLENVGTDRDSVLVEVVLETNHEMTAYIFDNGS